MYKSFTEMPAWQKSHKLSLQVFKLTESLPRAEDYGLTSQIRSSSNSINANIAEAFGRKHTKEKINFYNFARGSAFETQSHLLYGKGVGYFSVSKTTNLFNEYEQLIKDINKIMKTLNSQP